MFGREILWKWSHWFSYLFFLKGFHIKLAPSSDKLCLWEATLRKRSYRSRPLWRTVLWHRERPNAQKPEWSLSPSPAPSRMPAQPKWSSQQPRSQVRARWLLVAIELLYLFGSFSPLCASGLHLFTIKPWIWADKWLYPPLPTLQFASQFLIISCSSKGKKNCNYPKNIVGKVTLLFLKSVMLMVKQKSPFYLFHESSVS